MRSTSDHPRDSARANGATFVHEIRPDVRIIHKVGGGSKGYEKEIDIRGSGVAVVRKTVLVAKRGAKTRCETTIRRIATTASTDKAAFLYPKTHT